MLFRVMERTALNIEVTEIMKKFRYDAHPMGILVGTISALGAINKDANPALKGSDIFKDPLVRNEHIYNLIGLLPTIAANSYRHRIGRAYNLPNK